MEKHRAKGIGQSVKGGQVSGVRCQGGAGKRKKEVKVRQYPVTSDQ